MKQKNQIILVVLLFLFSCQKIEINRITKITTDAVVINLTEVTTVGTIVDIGKQGITKFGHCWSVNIAPTINDSKTEFANAESGKKFVSSLKNISANTTYYVRAYAANTEEIIYGETKSFILSAISSLNVTATNLQIVNESTLSVDGNISNVGSLHIADYGHCWATHTAPTINDNKTAYGSLSGDVNYSSTLSSLSLQTTYYVRAYFKLDDGTVVYSNELSILIPDLIITTDNYSITSSIATLQGTITSLGILPVTDHGMCWSTTTSNPNFNDNVLPLGAVTTIGNFFNILPVTAGNTYYYRAFARKGSIIKYGIVKSFTY